MSLKVIHAGIQSSVQDSGRTGFRAAGVPLSGAMDDYSYRVANILAGNHPNSPAIEFTSSGATLMAEEAMLIAFFGGGAQLYINQFPVSTGRPLVVPPLSLIQLRPSTEGYRSYLAVSGGIRSTTDLGSSSTYVTAALGGNDGQFLKTGDRLEIGRCKIPSMNALISEYRRVKDIAIASWGLTHVWFEKIRSSQIRVMKGRDSALFDLKTWNRLNSNAYTVSEQSNRMGYRLKGKKISSGSQQEMISTAVSRGSLQVTHGGDPALLMADAQVTGGYPVIAQVSMADIAICAQLRPGVSVSFAEISAEEAEVLYLKQEQDLARLYDLVRLQYYSS